MSAHPTTPGENEDHTPYYRQILHELIELGADLARQIHTQAKAAAPGKAPNEAPGTGPAAQDPTIPFDRIARAIRRTIALAQSLDHPPKPRPTATRATARQKIIRDVEDVINREAGGPEAECLHAELRERLDTPDLDDDIQSRPVADIITEIVRDLGLAHIPGTRPWKRRTPNDLKILRQRAAAPPGAASHPSLAISWPPPPRHKIPSEDLARMLASTRVRGK